MRILRTNAKRVHTNMKHRIIGVLALIVILVNLLPLPSAAAPSYTTQISPDQNDVSVLSVTVQINAG